MNVIFCNISWMKYYEGVIEEDLPLNGGEWVNEREQQELIDEGFQEDCNFKIYSDGYCYGSFMPTRNLDDKLKIERIQKGITSKDKYVEDVLVIWTATKPEGGRVIVGMK